ncbi:MAG: ABC transporter ATP-binding protein [Chloroflexi bacterium]|nr:ABC transporter ATP-binding protein [Chloroflexota bacterium]
MSGGGDILVRAEGLTKLFPISRNLFLRPTSFVHAVEDVSFLIKKGETLGLVGESGCGKTTLGKLLVKLLEPDSGHIYFPVDGEPRDVVTLPGRDLLRFRRQAQMIFQDPYESMNPRRTIYDTVAEPMVVQGIGSIREREKRVAEMLALVGVSPPQLYLFRYPHELSGGQRQRVAVARSLILNPSLVVADEPTSMLDVSVRSGVMKLMLELQQRFNISYLYVTHDLAVARYMCNRIAVMYCGKVVEMAEAEELLGHPLHPYTRALLSAAPDPDPGYVRPPVEIKGGVTTPVNPPKRCRFYDRCPMAAQVCEEKDHPPLEDKGGAHYVACYRV